MENFDLHVKVWGFSFTRKGIFKPFGHCKKS